ncbi:MAG TPA: O-antigen ligase family protein, partial [Bryobacterales bacterium]|nr:O-antigen ligase family protein [Bryobacterales bacterium]
MNPTEQRFYQASVWAMLLSAAAVVLSIAVSQIFLGLALIALLASDAPPRFPPLKAPLAAFMALTIVSMLASGDPAAGLPQVRKFFVYSVLLVAFTVLREARHARWLAGAWFLLAAVSALRSLVQFGQKVEMARERHEDFYQSYVGERITGFLSHWMTFSEVGMLVLLVLAAYLFFSPRLGRRTLFLCGLSGAVLLASLLASFTRSIWLATAAAATYLVWQWRKKLLLAAPLVVAAALAAGPGAFQRRVESIFGASGDRSIAARKIMWRTGWRMIEARPLVGVGPGRVGAEFRHFLPPDVDGLPAAYYGHLHNLYIQYAAERGTPALAAALWMLALILRDHLRA